MRSFQVGFSNSPEKFILFFFKPVSRFDGACSLPAQFDPYIEIKCQVRLKFSLYPVFEFMQVSGWIFPCPHLDRQSWRR